MRRVAGATPWYTFARHPISQRAAGACDGTDDESRSDVARNSGEATSFGIERSREYGKRAESRRDSALGLVEKII